MRAQDCEPGALATTPQATPSALPTQGSIVINEVLLVPLTAPLYCTPTAGISDTTNAPRIELYNTSAQSIQLPHGGIDSGPNTTVYNFMLDTIPAHSFIVIFLPTNQATEISQHAMIRLTGSGIVLDQVALPVLPAGNSYARTTDGGSLWHVTQNPTPGISNVPPPQATATAANKKPTATPKVRHTTPTARAKSSGRTRGHTTDPATGQTTDPAQDTAKAQVPNKYIQANWKDVHVPTPASHTGIIDISPASAPTGTQQSDSGNVLQKIILSVLLLALALVLWQCRRLFRRP
ncbi:hypothetical protein KSZ_28720 [Dictyobacter formicarum]|uniref:LTD domain-containing protein n=1 Tax=Dictyobacter formicarum TaxID=2778368 RepID=A0ABQ3VHC3_9CHLR|nr:hypothetical protein KSZ_28720 [Dictyobacter formicarum]